jgi:HEAT repeat protein
LADRIAGGLASPCAVERAAAARALGELGATEYTEALDAARGDPVPEVARAAARALATLRRG